MRDDSIKVGFCIAYDWYLLKYSLPLVYDASTVICLSIDKDRISWAGGVFSIDENEFYSYVNAIDLDKKIEILEEDFHKPELTPMQNEVRQRNRMAAFMGDGGWHVQLDCDEYFLHFSAFVKYLKSRAVKDKVNICCAWLTLYKQIENGFIYVLPQMPSQVEFIQVATRNPDYKHGRRNGHFNVYTRFYIIHQSWARTELEIRQKLQNWGHKNDFDGEAYLDVWQSVTQQNIDSFRNIHPTQSNIWPRLAFLEAVDVKDFVQKFDWADFPYTRINLILKNSRLLARIKQVVHWIHS